MKIDHQKTTPEAAHAALELSDSVALLRKYHLYAFASNIEESAPVESNLSFAEGVHRMASKAVAIANLKARERRHDRAKLPHPRGALSEGVFSMLRGVPGDFSDHWRSDEWIINGEWFVFTGKSGAGKTWWLTALAGSALDRGVDVVYFTENGLLSAWHRSCREGREKRLMDDVTKVGVLIIDDIGVNNVSLEDLHILRFIVGHRCGEESLKPRATLWASCNELNTWSAVWGEGLSSREAIIATQIQQRISQNSTALCIRAPSSAVL